MKREPSLLWNHTIGALIRTDRVLSLRAPRVDRILFGKEEDEAVLRNHSFRARGM
jgi:hypothetical protein